MEEVRLVFLFLSAFCLFGLVVGLYKPWVALWWEDVQNRKKVIQLYGGAGALTYLISLILQLLNTNQ